jgi:hypothetical protein
VLTVTSPLKMRNSETLSLSYSGTFAQTIALPRDPEQLRINLNAADALVTALGPASIFAPTQPRDDLPDDSWKRSHVWLDVPSIRVLEFLGSYLTHPRATSAKSSVLADFISRMNEIGELRLWTAALLAEGHPGKTHKFSSGLEISTFPSRSDTGVAGRYSIGVLTDPSDEAIDLGLEPWRTALAATRATWKPDPARGRETPPSRPSGREVREVRGATQRGPLDRGVLLLYPLSPLNDGRQIVQGWDQPIFAFAMAFPASETGIKVEYKVDLLYWEQEYGPSE